MEGITKPNKILPRMEFIVKSDMKEHHTQFNLNHEWINFDEMQFTLNFTYPLFLSQKSIPDELFVVFWDPNIFWSKEIPLPVKNETYSPEEPYIFQLEIPK